MIQPTPSDRQLVDAVLAGDRDAFRGLVERESPNVIGVCGRILRDPDEAQDVAQDTFIQAYRALATYRGDGPFGAWLRRIAIRLAISRLSARREVMTIDAANMDPDDSLYGTDESPETRFLTGEHRTAVIDAVAALPPEQQEVIMLRFFGDLSIPEIADRTAVPVGTVKSRLSRGVTNLRHQHGPEVAVMSGSTDFRPEDFTERVMAALAPLPDPTPTRTFVEALRTGSPRDALAALSVAWHLGTVRTWPVSTRVRARSFALVLAAVALLGTGSLVAAAAVHVVSSVPDRHPTVEPGGVAPVANPTPADVPDGATETALPIAREPGPEAEPSTEPSPPKRSPTGHDKATAKDGPTQERPTPSHGGSGRPGRLAPAQG